MTAALVAARRPSKRALIPLSQVNMQAAPTLPVRERPPATGGIRVRPLAAGDVPEVARLFGELLPPKNGPGQLGCRTYDEFVSRLFLQDGGASAEPRSLVAEDSVGRAVGFLGVLLRRMTIDGRPLRVAYSTSYIVSPAARKTFAGLQLMRTFLSGPQDLSLAEGSDLSRRIIEGLGGRAALLYSMHWSRVVRPGVHACDMLAEHGRAWFGMMARPLAPVADALARRSVYFNVGAGRLTARPLDVETMLAMNAACPPSESLQPVLDREQLQWRMDYATAKRPHVPPRAAALWTSEGEPAGWYVYQIGPERTARVLHLSAVAAQREAVLMHLLRDARGAGATIVKGRAQPSWLEVFSAQRCTLRVSEPWTLVHTKDDGLRRRIDQGDLHLSVWDGEWWLFV